MDLIERFKEKYLIEIEEDSFKEDGMCMVCQGTAGHLIKKALDELYGCLDTDHLMIEDNEWSDCIKQTPGLVETYMRGKRSMHDMFLANLKKLIEEK